MGSRHEDWLKQGQRDLAHARRSLEQEDFEWACFAAQQGTEKAVKAIIQKEGGVAWGHSVTQLLQVLPAAVPPATALLDAAKELDKHYIPARYPNSHPEGAPYEYYTRAEAERALLHAGQIIEFCARVLAGPGEDRGAPEASGRGSPPAVPGD